MKQKASITIILLALSFINSLAQGQNKQSGLDAQYESLKQHLSILSECKDKYLMDGDNESPDHWCWYEEITYTLQQLAELEYQKGDTDLAEKHCLFAEDVIKEAGKNCINLPKVKMLVHDVMANIYKGECIKCLESSQSEGLIYYRKLLKVASDNPDEIILIEAYDLDLLGNVVKHCNTLDRTEILSLAEQTVQVFTGLVYLNDKLRAPWQSIDEAIALQYSHLGFLFWKDVEAIDIAYYYYGKSISYLEERNISGESYEDCLGYFSSFLQNGEEDRIAAVNVEYKRFKVIQKRMGKEAAESYQAFSRLLNSCQYTTGYHLSAYTETYSNLGMYLLCCREWRKIAQEIQSNDGIDYFNSLLDYGHQSKMLEFEDYPDQAIKFGSVADTYMSEPTILLLQGNRDSAIVSINQALKYFKENEPEHWYDAAYRIAQTLESSDWYAMEEQLLNTIWNNASADDDSKRVYEVLSHFAALKLAIGENETAKALASIDDTGIFISSDLTSYVRNMLTLASLSIKEKDNLSAVRFFNCALSVLNGELPEQYKSLDDKIRFEKLPPADPSFSNTTLVGLSACYLRLNDYKSCKETLQELLEREFGNAIPTWDEQSYPMHVMEELAIAKYKQQQYDESIHIFEDCRRHQRQYGWSTTQSEGWMMACFHDKGDNEEFEKHSLAYLDNVIKDFMKQSSGMGETSRNMLWDISGNYTIENIGSIFCNGIGSYSTGLFYDIALNFKGFLLNYSSLIEKNTKSSDDEKLKGAYKRYKEAVASGDTLASTRENEFMHLYSLHPEFIDTYIPQKWEDVQTSLGKREVAIEFVRYYGESEELDTYNALLLTKKSKPILIELCKESTLVEVANKYQKAATSTNESLCRHLYQECNDTLYANIWAKLIPYMKHAKRMYFSPHGILSLLNIESVTAHTGKVMGDMFEIHRVSSTAVIISRKSKEVHSYGGAVLYGGLIYDANDTSENQDDKHTFTSTINDENRGKLDLSKPLNGTKAEIEAVDKLLTQNGFTDILYTGTKGTEDTFKNLSTLTVPIVHIATHGFYYDDKSAGRIDYYRMYYEDLSSYISPMKRAGVMLSGAEYAWEHGSFNGDSDNILFAEEIAGVDLSGTDLLVLSACQTGLGEIHGDGVYGLQRAFKLAGVGTIIMSLWNVDDKATQLMMTTFYKKLLEGKDKRKAFSFAIDKVKRSYSSPKYWGAFIMLD